MKRLIKQLVKWIWRIEVKGLNHYATAQASGRPILLVANHVSLWDGPLIDLFVPGRTTFMIHAEHTKGWKRWLLKLADFIEVDMHSPLAAKHMIHALQQGKQGMIFPEGRISTTGGMMKVYEGSGLVADKAGAILVPIFIDQAQFSKGSYLDGRFRWVKQAWFPKLSITILAPQTLEIDPAIKGHARHAQLKHDLYRILRDSRFEARFCPKTLTQALFDTAHRFGSHTAYSVGDAQGNQLSLKKLTLASRVLGYQLKQQLPDETYIGVLLPNVAAMAACFFALQAYARVPALLNFTAGETALRSACQTACLSHIITSRKFIELAGLQWLVEALSTDIEWIYLEDVREQIGFSTKLKALKHSAKKLPGWHAPVESPAAILFTSGSEGLPKAVVLSHQNLIANIEQISAMFALLPSDGVFNALPTFHSFGLTAGLLWPILSGARVELHPSPLHYHLIPERIYQTNARLFFATDTFYKGYARKADPYDFYSIDALVAGAEKLKPETRQLYADRFHKPIFEGYGVTETAPVLAVNIPQKCKHGTVGQFVPGIEWRLEPVEGLSDGGRLWVKGPNVMLGYFFADQPGVLQPPEQGWYDTGDLAEVDEEGFVTLLGRAKRFAKIAGEMISLAAIEAAINPACSSGQVVAVRRADSHKGECIGLVTDDVNLTKHHIIQMLKNAGLPEIAIPKTIWVIEQIPLLGTGKVDYMAIEEHLKQIADNQNADT